MSFTLSNRSLGRLEGVHPELVKVVHLAAKKTRTPLEFVVTEGVRSLARQEQLFAAGASQTMKSRHLTGHAVDLAAVVDGEVRWDWPLYDHLYSAMAAAAIEENVSIDWGGHWPKFKDGPHFELTWKRYPL